MMKTEDDGPHASAGPVLVGAMLVRSSLVLTLQWD